MICLVSPVRGFCPEDSERRPETGATDLDSAEVSVDAGVAGPTVRPFLSTVTSPDSARHQAHVGQSLSDVFELVDPQPAVVSSIFSL